MTDHLAVLEKKLASSVALAEADPDLAPHLQPEIDAYSAAIALMRGQSWQSVDDGFPPKHQWVLIYHDGFSVGRYWPCEKGVHDDNEWNWEVVGSDWVDNVTHWQPLPAPPKDPADEQ